MKNQYLYSIADAAKYYNIGKNKLYSMVRSEPSLPKVKVGQSVKIIGPKFEEWLYKCACEGKVL